MYALIRKFSLGTHDVQNISITAQFPGQIRVTGDFTSESTATGVLNIVYSLINSSVVHYTFAPHLSSVQRRIESVILELSSDYYSVAVFVVIESGLPFPRVASKPSIVQVYAHDAPGTVTRNAATLVYELSPTSTGVCITCAFLDSSTTDCVAVVHQRISQLSSSGLMNIESSHKFNRSGDTAYGCIEDVNLTTYQIGVIGQTKSVTSMPGLLFIIIMHEAT